MAKKSGSGIGRIFRAFGWSMSGLKATFLQEAAFRQELLLCIILAPLGLYFGETGLEKAMLMGSLTGSVKTSMNWPDRQKIWDLPRFFSLCSMLQLSGY